MLTVLEMSAQPMASASPSPSPHSSSAPNSPDHIIAYPYVPTFAPGNGLVKPMANRTPHPPPQGSLKQWYGPDTPEGASWGLLWDTEVHTERTAPPLPEDPPLPLVAEDEDDEDHTLA
jgi:hypothetical protein